MAAVRYTDKVQAKAFTVERPDGSFRDLDGAVLTNPQQIMSRIDRWRIINANDNFGTVGGATAAVANTLTAIPFVVESDLRLSQLGVFHFGTTGPSGPTRMRYGIYGSRPDGLPGALVISTPELDTTTTGSEHTLTPAAPLLLTPGIYYFTLLQNGGQVLRGVPLSMQRMVLWFGGLTATTPVSRLTVAQPYGPLPTVFPVTGIVQANGAGYTPPALFVKTTPN